MPEATPVLTPSFKKLEVTFESKSLLSLEFVTIELYEYEKADVWQLSFAEYHQGPYFDGGKEDCHYMVSQIDFFPSNEEDKAFEAFLSRLKSKEPWKSSYTGSRFEDFLTKKDIVKVFQNVLS